MSKPAHKQDAPAKKPGQIRNDITLGDYYERNGYVKKKMSFDEWWESQGLKYDLTVKARFMDCWDKAQENV